MFTVLRKVNGNRTPTEHKTVTLGGPESDVFKDAVRLIESTDSIDYLSPNVVRSLGEPTPPIKHDDAWAASAISEVKKLYTLQVSGKDYDFIERVQLLQKLFGTEKTMELCEDRLFRESLEQKLVVMVDHVMPKYMGDIAGGCVVIGLKNTESNSTVEDVMFGCPGNQYFGTELVQDVVCCTRHIELVCRKPKLFFVDELPDTMTRDDFEQLYVFISGCNTLNYRLNRHDTQELLRLMEEMPNVSPMLANIEFLTDFSNGVHVAYAKDVKAGKVDFRQKGLWFIIGVQDYVEDIHAVSKAPLEHGEGFRYYVNTKDQDALSFCIMGRSGLTPSPFKPVSIDYSEEVCEVSSVEVFMIPTDDPEEPLKEQILVARRRGKRPLSEAIGVLTYQAEEVFKDENGDDMTCDGACYEFFYQGDQVYVTNSVGKTVDSIR